MNYRKVWHDVKTQDGSIVKRCWPNAGKMIALDGTGREWAKGECLVRESP